MKTLFIPVKSKELVKENQILKILKPLPKDIIIAYSVQYENLAKKIKNLLGKHNILSFIQVLGCSKPKIPKKAKAILLISSGKFHAVSLAYETKIPVYILNSNKLQKISKKDLEIIEKNQKISYLKFFITPRSDPFMTPQTANDCLKGFNEEKFACQCDNQGGCYPDQICQIDLGEQEGICLNAKKMPRVTMVLKLENKTNDSKAKISLNLQTTISARYYE